MGDTGPCGGVHMNLEAHMRVCDCVLCGGQRGTSDVGLQALSTFFLKQSLSLAWNLAT